MSLYAIEDEDGKLHDVFGELPSKTKSFVAWPDYDYADTLRQTHLIGGHVVELVKKAETVEVSKAAGRELTDLREELAHGYTANSANYYVDTLKLQHGMSTEDIFHALDVGWTVVKPRRYVLPMPDGTSDELDQGKYLAIRDIGGIWHGSENRYDITKPAELEYFFVTQDDIGDAPAWVKAITPVEVTDHD